MIARLLKHSQFRFGLIMTVMLMLSMFLQTGPLAAAAPPASISWLWQAPPDQAQVELRLTSVDSTGKRQMADAILDYFRDEDSLKLKVSVKTKDRKDLYFCFRCEASNSKSPCDVKEGIMPDSMEALIPGTQLSWLALTAGFCSRFEAHENMQLSDGFAKIYDVLPLEENNQDPKFKLRVFVSRTTNLPTRIVYINNGDRELSVTDIHEIRNTLWGRVITRSIYRHLKTGSRVLIEVRSGTIGMPAEMERR